MPTSIISLIGLATFILEILLITILIIFSGMKWKKNKINVIGLLFSVHALFLVFLLTEAILLLVNMNDPVGFYLTEGNFVVSLFPFFGGVSAGFYLLFIDYFIHERISPLHASIYGLFLGAFMLNVIFKVIFPEIIPVSSQIDSSSLILLILTLLVSTNFPASYFVIYVIIITLFTLSEVKKGTFGIQRKQITYLQLTVLSYYGYTTLIVVIGYVFSDFFDPNLTVFLRHIAPHFGVILGSILILTSYLRSPAGFLQFHRLEKLIVVNLAGLPLFSYDFEHFIKTRIDREALLSGGVYAILNLFSEMIETKKMTQIHFQDKRIALSYHESFLCILIADKITKFSSNALESFNRMFSLRGIVTKGVFEDARRLVILAFQL
ncbi:MAG: hypothetical protein ACW964_10855 [Candidatus Hodarchaeales archaeon]|jgi:hypothetical protein